MSLNEAQINALLAPLHPGRVQKTQGNSNLEAWDVRRWLLRIFGWGGWEFHIVSCDLVSERSTDTDKPRHTVVYRVIGRLVIKDTEGKVLAVFEDGATGDAINQPSLGDAHDFALKTALSQALKRCAVNLGDQFGMSLYQKGSTNAVVGKSAAHPNTDEHEVEERVTGGELTPPPTAALPESSDQVSGSAVSGPAASDESVSAPSSAPSTEDVVASLRDRAIEATAMKKRDGIQLMARLNAEAAKARLMQAPTTRPDGTATTLNVLLDEAMRRLNTTSDAA